MKKASWIVLTTLGVVIVVLSLVSAFHAYVPSDDFPVGGVRVSKIAQGNAALEAGLRGVRGTSAAYGAAFGLLFVLIAAGPYRRGEVWAWKALAAAGTLNFVLVVLRIPLIGTSFGVQAAISQGGLLLLGLALDAGRLRRASH